MSIRGKRVQWLHRRPDGRLALGLLGLTVVAAVTLAGSPPASAQPIAAHNTAHSAVQSSAAPSAVPAPPAGFTTTWSDDFNGPANAPLDTGTWRYDAGLGANFGTGEVETTTTSTANVFTDGNGHLVLKALHTGTDPVAGWTSGRVETQFDGFGAEPGGVVRMQASIQQPNINTANGAGYWPAFWMLGSPIRIGVPWPGTGEVDIMEDINGRSSLFGTLHCGTNPGGPCNESTGIGSGERACAGCQTGFHTYAVEIDRSTSPEQIRYILDGATYFTVSANQVDPTTWANAVDHAFFIIFDLAIGGAFPAAFGGGPNAATVSGGQMNIDYVAVYNKAPNFGTNLALGKPTTASSVESAAFPASNATDGNVTTRWSSTFSDPQWLQVDLGAATTITHATLIWEASAASAYQIQTSNDATNWTTIFTNNNSTGEIQDVALSGSGRFIRVLATARASAFGDSLYEFAVYGTSSGGRRRRWWYRNPAVPRQAHDGVVGGERRHPGVQRHRRQHHHPVVQLVRRPAVATGRPRRQRHHQPGGTELGGSVRHRIPDTDITRRHQLDHDLLDNNRHRRHPNPASHRNRPLRPHERHRTSNPVRLLTLGVPGLRHREHQHRRRQHQPVAGQGGHGVVDGERLVRRGERGRRQHRHPVVQHLQ